VDEPETEQSTFDRIWGLATLYEGDGPVLQELSFVGRYHGQHHSANGESGQDQGWEHRRIRLGLAGRFLRDFDFKFALDMAFEDDRPTDHLTLKNGLTDAFVAYQPSEAFRAVLGKHWVRYTQEGSTSSNRIRTVERSLLVNQVWPTPELLSGVMVEGHLGGGELVYRVGAYAGDKQRGLTRFEAGVGFLASLGHSFGAVLGSDEVLVRADWFYNDGHPENNAFRDYAHVVSLGGNIDAGKFALTVDVLAAEGLDGVSDAWGLVLLPSYSLTDRLEGVVRYHHAASSEPGGLSAAPRHEEPAGGGVGDNYHSAYAGLNYYVYGQQLKVMSGVEFSVLDGGNEPGWDGWTLFLGTRVFW